MQQRWDKISIIGHTDDTEDDEYNLELSKKELKIKQSTAAR
jgi:outer membrane protein OmpA-like peptidoglycan-associated protein